MSTIDDPQRNAFPEVANQQNGTQSNAVDVESTVFGGQLNCGRTAPSLSKQEILKETIRTSVEIRTTEAKQQACLVHIYPTGPGMGTRYPLGDRPIIIGRSSDCDIEVEDNAVSRYHVRIEATEDGYRAIDLKSTNGTIVNHCAAPVHLLKDGDYLQVGTRIFRFLAGGNIENEYHEVIYRLSIMDELTNIHNKRYLLEFLKRELDRTARYKRPLALLLFDIDHFKRINDEFGHLAGDYILRELAGCVKATLRHIEMLARYGGEEFALAMPETSVDEAFHAAERIRRRVEEHAFYVDHTRHHVTISIGVAGTTGEPSLSPEELVQAADERLYEAKRQGRNRVVA